MHKIVKFRDRQEHQAADHNNLQAFARETVDDLTRDAVTDDRKYSGFETTQATTTEISVAAGRLYDTGRQYVNESATSFNLLSNLPLATKKKVAVVAWGATIETDVQPRDFLIDVDNNETEPQAVAMQELRRANLDIVPGVEGANPQPPLVAAPSLVIAIVTLGTTGILSIEMVAANRLENVESLSGRVSALDQWRTQAGTRLETLASDLSGLAGRQHDVAQGNLLEQLMFDVARMRRALDLPASYTGYGADLLVTTELSDTARVGYSAKIEEGLGFAADAEDVRLIQLFNSFDSTVKVHGSGLLLPAYTHELRVSVPGYSGDKSLTEYQVQTWGLVRKHNTRWRTRFGNRWRDYKAQTQLQVLRRTTIGPNSEPVGSPYPVAPILFSKSGEAANVWQAERAIRWRGQVKHDKSKRFYRKDSWSEPYWTQISTETSVDGALRAQSFLNAQDGWVTKIGLHFTSLAASGDVRVSIAELTDAGTPDMEAVLAETTLARANMKVYPEETPVEVGPVFLRAGRRYAIVLLSQAAHRVALGEQLAYSGGAFFHSVDGAYFTGDQLDDLKFNLYYAKFAKTWLQVQLQPLSLSGGISDIDLLQEGWVPESCALVYEVQKPGGQWVSIAELPDDTTTGPLSDLPPLMNFRAVFSGTPDVMPGINLAATQQTLSRPKTAFTHFSTAITLPAASSTIKVKVVLNDYVEANHDLTATLLCGVGETVETADATVDQVLEDGQIVRTFTFNTAAAHTTFKIKFVGATAGATQVYSVQERSYVAT